MGIPIRCPVVVRGRVGAQERSSGGDLVCWLVQFTVELSSYLLGPQYA